jgi:hypothetical protein
MRIGGRFIIFSAPYAVEYRCAAGAILHLLGGLVRYTNRSKESERLGLAEEVHSLAWAKLNPPVPV